MQRRVFRVEFFYATIIADVCHCYRACGTLLTCTPCKTSGSLSYLSMTTTYIDEAIQNRVAPKLGCEYQTTNDILSIKSVISILGIVLSLKRGTDEKLVSYSMVEIGR